MTRINTITVGTGGGTGFLFGALTTEQLLTAFILGAVGALGGLFIKWVYTMIVKLCKR